MTPSPYTEDTLLQQTTADYLERQLGWEPVDAHHRENFRPKSWCGRRPMRASSKHASAEYFLPVTGLLFLRHASSRYLAVTDAITAGLPIRGGLKRPAIRENSQKNTLSLRPEARFDHFVARPDGADRPAAINAAAERRPNSKP